MKKKLYLTADEKKRLAKECSIDVERVAYLPAPKSSIVHGIGDRCLFDRIDYCWVYGNTAEYIKAMKNVGRRATDYKHNLKNTWNGAYWWDLERQHEDCYQLNKLMTNGKKNVVSFRVTRQHLELQKRENSEYFDIVIKLRVTLTTQPSTGYTFDEQDLAEVVSNF